MKRRQYGLRLAAVTAASAAVAAAAGVPAVASAKKKHAHASNPVTLNMVVANYGTGTSRADNNSQYFWQAAASAFHKKNPSITVKVTAIPWTNWDSQVQTQIKDNNIPDLTEGDYFTAYAQEHMLYNANQVTSSKLQKDFLPAIAAQSKYKGKLYGLPWTVSTRALFTNTKILKQAGIKTPPKTWAQLKTDAVKIHQKTGKIGFALALGSEEADAEALLMFAGDGGNYTQGGKGVKWTINSPQNIKAFQFYDSIVKAGGTDPNPATYDRTAGAWTQFEHGQVGITFGQNALVGNIQAAHALPLKDVKVTPLPGEHGALKTTLAVADHVSAFNAHHHAAQIKKFLDFVYGNKYQLQWSKEYGFTPPTTSGTKVVKNHLVKELSLPLTKRGAQTVQFPSANPGWSGIEQTVKNTIGTALTNPAGVLGTLQQDAIQATKSAG